MGMWSRQETYVLIPYESGSVSDEYRDVTAKGTVVLIPYESGSVSDQCSQTYQCISKKS